MWVTYNYKNRCEINEKSHIKTLEQCLVRSRGSVNVHVGGTFTTPAQPLTRVATFQEGQLKGAYKWKRVVGGKSDSKNNKFPITSQRKRAQHFPYPPA